MLKDNLKKFRHQKNLGVNELSRITGINASYISAIERGLKANPGLEILEKLAGALDVSVSNLLVEEGKESQETSESVDLNDDILANPDIRRIARAGQKMTTEQAETLRKVAETLFPEAFKK